MASVEELDALREQYARERPIYAELAEHVAAVLGEAVKSRGIYCRTESRAKDVSSLVKKAIRKGYSSLGEVGDMAGARVIVPFADSVSEVEDVVGQTFEVRWRQDKSQGLAPQELGYLGVHLEVTVRRDDSSDYGRFGDRACEVQLHTTAQRAWADVSHELLYKPDASPDPSIMRVLFRLMALVELFDESVVRSRQTLMTMPGWREAVILGELERLFLALTARDFDRELSLMLLSGLIPTFGTDDTGTIQELIREFVRERQPKIKQIFSDYSDDPRHPLLFQPETLLVFERLEADPFRLRDQWQRILPIELLGRLAEVWGMSI